MKKKYKYLVFIVISIIFVITIIANIESKKIEMKSADEKISHSLTMNINVIEKVKDKERNSDFSIVVKNQNKPYQQYSITIKDEKLWNLINVNGGYFVVVSWVSNVQSQDITDKKNVNLQQIEVLK